MAKSKTPKRVRIVELEKENAMLKQQLRDQRKMVETFEKFMKEHGGGFRDPPPRKQRQRQLQFPGPIMMYGVPTP